MSFVIVEIGDGFLKTSKEEWHGNPRCIASAHEVISIKTLGNGKN